MAKPIHDNVVVNSFENNADSKIISHLQNRMFPFAVHSIFFANIKISVQYTKFFFLYSLGDIPVCFLNALEK